MTSFLSMIFSFLTVPPGNLIYHLVLVFIIAGALQGAIHALRSGEMPNAKRTVYGLGLLMGLQLVLFLAGALCYRGLYDPNILLPPLDRAVSFISIIWIAWLWAFPEPVRYADATSVLVSLLGVALFGLTFVLNVMIGGGPFNQTRMEIIWQGCSAVVVLLGFLGLVLRRPTGWENGLAMLLIALAGHLLSLVWHMQGDYPGVLRLAHLASYPILLTLSQRYPRPVIKEAPEAESIKSPTPEEPKGTDQKGEAPPWQERRRYSTDAKTFQSLIALAAVSQGDKICPNLTRAIAQAMLADLCFLVIVAQDKSLSIVCGYDLIREESLGGTSVEKNSVPTLINAIQKGKALRLAENNGTSDMKGLSKILGLTHLGHLLCVPIPTPEGATQAGIVVLSPYSTRQWNADDQVYLTSVSSLLMPVLERGQKIKNLEIEREMALKEAKQSKEELDILKSKARGAPAGEPSPELTNQLKLQAENLTAMTLMNDEAQKTIEELRKEIETLQAATPAKSEGKYQDLEGNLQQALEDMGRMQNALAESRQKVKELESRPPSPITNEQVEVIASISQDLRQPMSSIIGYTDLLLGESVGILGALQRKFVERVKASTERLGGLIEDLIQITNLDTGRIVFKPEMIDLNLIIDNAMAYTSTVIREKNITLRLDIPDKPPEMMTDKDALQQVLIHLLQNATAVTPLEGTISLRVQTKEEDNNNFLTIQVTDSGGGIAAEDLPRVFARRYRAEHSLIQGVGDTGVGLSIAKTMVEAQGGRIWVETVIDVGSTFSVLLPVVPVEMEE